MRSARVGAGAVFALHDNVRFGKCSFGITIFVTYMRRDVTAFSRVFTERFCGEVFVEERSVIFHRFQDIDNRWQGFIFHIDEVERFFRDVGVDRSHCCH